MKYVKLFESWLNEEDGASDEIKSFDKQQPRDWPVMKTTIKMLYSGPGGKLDGEVLASILGRANQESKSKKFDETAEINVISLGGTYGPSIDNDGNLMITGDRAITGQDRKEMQKMFKNIAKPDAVKDNLSTMKTLKAFAIGDNAVTRDEAAIVTKASRNSSMCLIVLPREIKDIINKPDSSVINMNVMVIFNEVAYATLMANLLAFIKDGLTDSQFFTEKDQYANVSAIFAGETAGSLIAFDKTIGGKRFITTKRTKEEPSDSNMKPRDGVYTIDTAGEIQYVGQILFEFDKAVLTEEAKKVLSSGALKSFIANAALDKAKSIKIVGHADGMGDAAYNKKLSEERAKSVLGYMDTLPWWKNGTEKMDVKTEGMGSSQPVKDDKKGTDPDASSLNRRVEFILDDKKPDYSNIKVEKKS